jgi:hypothetical protein
LVADNCREEVCEERERRGKERQRGRKEERKTGEARKKEEGADANKDITR